MAANHRPAKPPGPIRRAWRKVGRAVITLWAAVLLPFAVYWGYTASNYKASVCLLIILLTATILQLIARYFAPGAELTVTKLSKTMARPLVVRELLAGAVTANEKYSSHQLHLLAELLLNPSHFRTRVVEEIDLGRGMARTSVSTTLAIEPDEDSVDSGSTAHRWAAGDTILVPVLTPRKARLYDRRVITDGSGAHYSPISQGTSAALCAGLVLHVFKLAYKLKADPSTWDDTVRWNFLAILDAIARSRTAEEDPDTVASLVRPVVDSYDETALRRLQQLVGLFATRYAIVAEMPYAVAVIVDYRHESLTASLAAEPPKKSTLKVTRVIQRLFRIPSGYIEIEAAQAKNCQSYHMYLQVPPGSYIGPSQLVSGDSLVGIDPHPEFTTTIPYLRPILPSGSFLHVYGRGLQSLPTGSLFKVRVYERPYGTELYGAIACMALLAVSIILKQAYVTDGSIDVGAAVLGVPVALATVGAFYGSAARRSLTASTIGILGGLAAGVGSALLLLTFMVEQATPDHPTSATGHTAHWWTWFVGGSVAIASLAVSALLVRILRYLRPRL